MRLYLVYVTEKMLRAFLLWGSRRVFQKHVEVLKRVNMLITFQNTYSLELFGIGLCLHKGVMQMAFEHIYLYRATGIISLVGTNLLMIFARTFWIKLD